MNSESSLEIAKRDIQQGDKVRVRAILAELIRHQPRNEVAWFLLAGIMDDSERIIYCLEQVLRINPKNEDAQRELTLWKQKVNQKQEEEQEDLKEIRKEQNGKIVNCKTCGKDVSRLAPSCPYCGENYPGLRIKCPRCGSSSFQAGEKGFSLGKAALGGVLLGPVGLLGGVLGSKNIEFACLNCNYRWKPNLSEKKAHRPTNLVAKSKQVETTKTTKVENSRQKHRKEKGLKPIILLLIIVLFLVMLLLGILAVRTFLTTQSLTTLSTAESPPRQWTPKNISFEPRSVVLQPNDLPGEFGYQWVVPQEWFEILWGHDSDIINGIEDFYALSVTDSYYENIATIDPSHSYFLSRTVETNVVLYYTEEQAKNAYRSMVRELQNFGNEIPIPLIGSECHGRHQVLKDNTRSADFQDTGILWRHSKIVVYLLFQTSGENAHLPRNQIVEWAKLVQARIERPTVNPSSYVSTSFASLSVTLPARPTTYILPTHIRVVTNTPAVILSQTKRPTSTPLPSTSTPSPPPPNPRPSHIYSLLDDLENLIVIDSQGKSFNYSPGSPYYGWYLLNTGWGRVCDARNHDNGRAGHTVGGAYAQGQVLIHPVSTDLATIVSRTFSPLSYNILTLAYALADGAVNGSDGVMISLRLINANNDSTVLIPSTKVTQNVWTYQNVDLGSYFGQMISLRLEVDAIENTNYDWLEVQMTLDKT